MESLIKAGALDSMNTNRAQHLAMYEGLLESAQNDSKKNIEGQFSLFQSHAEEMATSARGANLPIVAPFAKEMLAAMEKEMLGVYITEHPLQEYWDVINRVATVTSDELIRSQNQEEGPPAFHDGESATLVGIINTKRTLITKSNKMMAFVQLEDLVGVLEVIIFPNVYERYSSLIAEDRIVGVKGKLNFKEDELPKIIADTIFDVKEADAVANKKTVKIRIPNRGTQKEDLESIKDLLTKHRGDTPVLIYTSEGKTLKTGSDLWVDANEAFCSAVNKIIGDTNLKIQ